MSDFVNNGYELDWDSEIENEGTPFVVAEPGDYYFTVTNMERTRFAGSQKMPPCNQAKLTIELDVPGGKCEVKHNLFLHSKTEWKLCEFFTSIGQRKQGTKVQMNWNAVVGARGRCKVSKRSYKSKDGRDMETNDIDKFYSPEDTSDLPFEWTQTAGTYPPQPAYQQPAQQPNGYQQPTYQQQAMYPGAAAQIGGYTPGKF